MGDLVSGCCIKRWIVCVTWSMVSVEPVASYHEWGCRGFLRSSSVNFWEVSLMSCLSKSRLLVGWSVSLDFRVPECARVGPDFSKLCKCRRCPYILWTSSFQ